MSLGSGTPDCNVGIWHGCSYTDAAAQPHIWQRAQYFCFDVFPFILSGNSWGWSGQPRSCLLPLTLDPGKCRESLSHHSQAHRKVLTPLPILSLNTPSTIFHFLFCPQDCHFQITAGSQPVILPFLHMYALNLWVSLFSSFSLIFLKLQLTYYSIFLIAFSIFFIVKFFFFFFFFKENNQLVAMGSHVFSKNFSFTIKSQYYFVLEICFWHLCCWQSVFAS